MAHVRQVVRFLEGDDDAVYQQLWRGLENAAARLDFERARRLRNDMQLLQHVVSTERALRQATERHTLLLILPSAVEDHVEVLMVVRGRLWAKLMVSRGDTDADLVERLARSWERHRATGNPLIDHDSLDESHILNRWLARNWEHPAVLLIAPLDNPDWSHLARRALNLTDIELTSVMVDVREETEPPNDEAEDSTSSVAFAHRRDASGVGIIPLQPVHAAENEAATP